VRHVILVGATHGIGLALARAYVERSWRVGLVGRSAGRVDEAVADLREGFPGSIVEGGVLDVTRRDQVAPALDRLVVALGQMDLLVYCAGVMEEGRRGTQRMLDVNVRGAVDVLEWGASHLREVGEGRLAAIGSVAGDRGRRGNPVYGASKAALHAYLEGLRHRLHPDGVGVSTIKPGWVRTRMLGPVPGFPPSVAPSKAADIIVRGLDAERDVFYVPRWWWLVSRILQDMPRSLFKRFAPS
jgi:NAD(P)-dependent dehydrogenase (short-subunit alcohol dehydrogenase family)